MSFGHDCMHFVDSGCVTLISAPSCHLGYMYSPVAARAIGRGPDVGRADVDVVDFGEHPSALL